MVDGPVVLSVVIEAVPGREEDLAAQLQALVAPTQSEAGCMQYKLHRSPENPGTFLFYEKFINQAALDAHLETPHFQGFVKYRDGNDPIANQNVMRWLPLA
ncbi:MAG TPA: putative quinol monooxygenase [Edaphobacter sp.]|nr:putative quinol monooxygenase [Edaphobacter sp.]